MLNRISVFLLSLILALAVSASTFCSPVAAEEQRSNRDEVVFTLGKAIASKYYDFKKRRIIRISCCSSVRFISSSYWTK